MKKIVFVIFLLLFFTSFLYAKNNADKFCSVKVIEVKGQKQLTGYMLLKNVDIKSVNKKIIINLGSLKHELNKNLMLENFSVKIKNNRLILSIVEKKIYLNFAVSDKGGEVIPFSVDENFNFLSRVFFRKNFPIIFINRNDVKDKKIAKSIILRLSFLNKLKKNFLNLFKEINQIDVRSENFVKIKLRGRKTLFYMKDSFLDFYVLQKIISFLDEKGSYPDKIDVFNSRVLVKF